MNSAVRGYLSGRKGGAVPVASTAGRRGGDEPLRFVIQKHAARQQHYDLLLEAAGVLKSWVIPHGPSSDPKESRLALMMRDYPLDRANFEGVIPRGSCGAGEVIVWDAGVYSPDEDDTFFFGDRKEAEGRVLRGLAEGRLSLFFWGYRLAGSWALLRRRGSQREWVFQKRDDLFAEPTRDLVGEERSVLSGRTTEELREEASDAPRQQRA
jgi:bifunctional non-homologous end joining protein LigD